MERITWFKDQFGDVHVWYKEVVPFTTILDSADFCIQCHEPSVKFLVPGVEKAEELDWGWIDVPFIQFECIKNVDQPNVYEATRVGVAV